MNFPNIGACQASKKAKIISAAFIVALLGIYPVAVYAESCLSAYSSCMKKWYMPEWGCEVLYQDCVKRER